MIQEGFRIGVIVRIYQSSPVSISRYRINMTVSHSQEDNVQDCFTQSNFFQAPFLLRRPPVLPNFRGSFRPVSNTPRGGRKVPPLLIGRVSL